MIALPFAALSLTVPEVAPVLDAVKACSRDDMRMMIRGEPHRRTEFAAAVFAEQRAIAAERAPLLVARASAPAGAATVDTALAQLDARQKQLDDARVTEKAWRELFDEARADYLANCTAGKKDAP